MNLSPHRKSFSNQEKKGRKPNSHLHQKAKKSLLTYMYVVLQKTPSLKPSMAKNLCWHHEVLPAKAAFTSTVFLVSLCILLSVLTLYSEQVSLCWKKFVNIIFYFQILQKRVLQKQSHSASMESCKPVAKGSQWSKNSNYPIGSKFATNSPDCRGRNDCAEQLIILPWACSTIKKKGSFSHNHV